MAANVTDRLWSIEELVEAHAGLVSLKPSIQGPNRDEVIAAIDDLLEKLKK